MCHSDSKDVEYRSLEFLGCRSYYRIGDDGSLWSRRLGGWVQIVPKVRLPGGHLRVQLNLAGGGQKWFYIHQLVLLAFVGSKPEKMECRHFPDQNPANNRLENLSWATKQQNMADKLANGTAQKGMKHGYAKLTDNDLREIRQTIADNDVLGVRTALAKKFGVSQTLITYIIKRRNWTHIE